MVSPVMFCKMSDSVMVWGAFGGGYFEHSRMPNVARVKVAFTSASVAPLLVGRSVVVVGGKYFVREHVTVIFGHNYRAAGASGTTKKDQDQLERPAFSTKEHGIWQRLYSGLTMTGGMVKELAGGSCFGQVLRNMGLGRISEYLGVCLSLDTEVLQPVSTIRVRGALRRQQRAPGEASSMTESEFDSSNRRSKGASTKKR
ncbi:hypothetical protein B0H14DRAFT_3142548 [Mycena olivaceomarginata]|nr:hypothetical protein B0H14DRAFT_3142548 [Mycena olivaceomarginata]